MKEPAATFLELFESINEPIFLRNSTTDENAAKWNPSTNQDSLPTGNMSQLTISVKSIKDGIFQRFDANKPATKAESAGLNGVKGPKIGG